MLNDQEINDLLTYIFDGNELYQVRELIEENKFNSVRQRISNQKDNYENRIHYISTKNNYFAKSAVNILNICNVLEDYFINKIENNDRTRI